MIISVLQHNGDRPVVATPQHYRYLQVQRRFRIWRCAWGGWDVFSNRDERFPQGFELPRKELAAGNWLHLRARTIRIPFEKYAYFHEADGCCVEVNGPGFLLGAHLSTNSDDGAERIEHVFLVISPEGHYYHSPNAERRQNELPNPPPPTLAAPSRQRALCRWSQQNTLANTKPAMVRARAVIGR